MITSTATLTGREYLRVSKDKSGDERSPEEQHDENMIATGEAGIVLLDEPYRDVGSASRHATKARKNFDRLIDDLKNDTFGADVLVLWESSRGSRRTGEWITLIELCEERGIKIFVSTHERLYDPAHGRDRKSLIDDASDSEYESWKIRERVMRSMNANVAAGKPHGRIPFGYMREYAQQRNARGKSAMRPVGQKPDPAVAVHAIELFQRIKAGDPFLEIERDWAARGIVGRNGAQLKAQNLRAMAMKVLYIGERVHHGMTTQGDWPVIADFEGSPMTPDEFVALFHEVQVILADPKRQTTRPGGTKHAYSRTIKCAVCGSGVGVSYRAKNERPEYVCRDHGCVKIDKEETDKIVTAEIVAYLARPEVYHAVVPEDGGAELAQVRSQLTVKRAQLEAFEDEDPETPAEVRLIARKIEKLEAETTALEQRETALTPRPSPLAALFNFGPDVEKRWEATPIARKRQIAALLLTPDVLGEVRITKAAERGSVTDRIKWATVA
ncbi:recombinase family protein [Streptomyces sp. NBC_00588]|uniref:recombinase family protein n=1 Tax=Streptomyces sp. NBC_00588 TaxID=2975784 RepID=UPI002E801DDA|nr:recombinase family protein [Streptomyces sp. NBC_00588]WUB35506.1 recombinase family protein [Streptomyces sp. NBC_00588]